MSPVAVPSAPAAKPMAAKSSEEFTQLKRSLNEIASWEISPNDYSKIPLIYKTMGTEQQARSFVKAIQLPTPEM